VQDCPSFLGSEITLAPNHDGHVARRGDEIARAPGVVAPRLGMRESRVFLPQETGRGPLDRVDPLGDVERRVRTDQQVDAIDATLDFHDFNIVTSRQFNHSFLCIGDDVVTFQKYLLPVLHHEDAVVVEGMDVMGFFLVLYVGSLNMMVTTFFMLP
jgi:hypothetical protein